MKFKYIEPDKNDANAYNILAGLKTGDIIELDGHMAEKALKNPSFEKVGNNAKVTITPEEGKIAREKRDARDQMFKTSASARIAELERQIRELKQQSIERQEEGVSVDDVFLEDSPLDEVRHVV